MPRRRYANPVLPSRSHAGCHDQQESFSRDGDTDRAQANGAASKPKGLADSRYANEDAADEGEDQDQNDDDESDHDSAALALVRKPLCDVPAVLLTS